MNGKPANILQVAKGKSGKYDPTGYPSIFVSSEKDGPQLHFCIVKSCFHYKNKDLFSQTFRIDISQGYLRRRTLEWRVKINGKEVFKQKSRQRWEIKYAEVFLSSPILPSIKAEVTDVTIIKGNAYIAKEVGLWSNAKGKGNAVQKFRHFGEEFTIEFDFTPYKVNHKHHLNILSMARYVGNSKTVLPSIWMFNNKGQAGFRFESHHINDQHIKVLSRPFPLGQPIHIIITQGKFWADKDKIFYAISVDGEVIYAIENVWPTRRNFVLYLTDPWHISARGYGKMTNLKVYPFGYSAWI